MRDRRVDMVATTPPHQLRSMRSPPKHQQRGAKYPRRRSKVGGARGPNRMRHSVCDDRPGRASSHWHVDRKQIER